VCGLANQRKKLRDVKSEIFEQVEAKREEGRWVWCGRSVGFTSLPVGPFVELTSL